MATPLPTAAPGGPAGGIQWTASIINQTGSFFSNFNQNINTATKTASQGFQNIGNSTAPVMDSLSKMGTAFAQGLGLGAMVGFLSQSVAFFKELGAAISNVVEKSTQAAARYEMLGAALNALGVAAGYSVGELANIEAELRAVGTSGITARDAMMRLIEVDVDLAEAQKLLVVAQNVSIVANTSVEEALRREIHGLATLNPYVFRRLGLIVDLDRAYLDMARSLGISSDALSIELKQEAAVQAILRAGEHIRGAFNASLETAGGLAKLMPRYMTDFMVALGAAFQPVYLRFLQTFRDLLIESTTWLTTNEKDVRAFGDTLADVFDVLVSFVDILGKAGDVLKTVSKGFGDFLVTGGEFLALFAKKLSEVGDAAENLSSKDIKEMDARVANLGETAKQTATILVTSFLLGFDIIITYFDTFINLLDVGFTNLGKKMRGEAFTPTSISASFREATGQISADALEIFDKVGKAFNVIDELGTTTGPDELAARMERLRQQTEDATSSIMKLQESLAKDMADLAKRWARADEDEFIKNSRRREDIEIRYQKKLQSIRDSYNKKKQDLAKQEADDDQKAIDDSNDKIMERMIKHQQDLEDIEIDFRRKLADITQEYYDEVDEAARNNDAVAVVRAIRERNRKIRDAALDRDRSIEDKKLDLKRDLEAIDRDRKKQQEEQKKDRDTRRQELEDDLKQQLQDAQDARDEDYENLILSQKREAEDKALARKRDLEDLDEKNRAERIMLAAHLAGLELLDQASIAALLTEHGAYITTDLEFWAAYWKQREAQAQTAMANIARFVMPPSYDVNPGTTQPPSNPWPTSFASGGFGIATSPRDITVGDETPEAFAAIPLASMSTINHNINLRGGISVNGVSKDMESQLAPAMYGILKQFADALLSRNQQFTSRR